MKFYLAPLEGVTGYIYRNAYYDIFGGFDKYFAPFISPSQNRKLAGKEIRDILPENNENVKLIPQVLASNPKYFIRGVKQIEEMGYDEINFNAGCPSGTVVTKGKGAGFLKDTEQMDRFFEEVFDNVDVKLSVKTRIGMETSDNFEKIMEVYNRYPFHEVIIHPRTREQMYKGCADIEAFRKAEEISKNRLCYNGDIFTTEDYHRIICKELGEKNITAVMLGRGIIGNPNLLNEIKNDCGRDYERIKKFHDRLYHDYKEIIHGDIHIIYKMREIWNYLSESFPDSHKCLKMIRKASNLYKYDMAVEEIFQKVLK